MEYHIHIHIPPSDEMNAKLDAILTQLTNTKKEIEQIMTDVSQNFKDLQAEVAAETEVEAGAVKLINGFSAQLQAAIDANTNGDTAALPTLLASIKASSDSLAAAVAANTTPAAPVA